MVQLFAALEGVCTGSEQLARGAIEAVQFACRAFIHLG